MRELRPPGFARLFTAHTVSRWGDTFNVVALAVLVFRLTGSGIGVGGVVVAEIVPVLLLGPLAGAAADRFRRVRVMVAADLWRAALAAVLPLVAGNVGAVYAVAFGLSAGSVFFNPASASLLPDLVPPERLVRANATLWTSAVLSQIVLAPVAGLAVAALGFTPSFLLNAASFLFSAGALSRLDVPRGEAVPRLKTGFRLLWSEPVLRVLAAAQLLAALGAGATSALLVVLAQRRLGVGPGGYGLLLGAIGVGASIGPFLLTRLTIRPRTAFIFGPYVVRGLVDMVLASVRSPAPAAGALVLYGIGTSTGMVAFNAFVQQTVRPELRGRAFAGFDVLWQAGRLVSLGLGGLAADALGIRAIYVIGALLMLAAGGVGLLPGARRD